MSITLSEDLSCLLREHGIAESYTGYAGELVEIPVRDRIAILACKGTDVMDTHGQLNEHSVRHALEILKTERWKSVLPPVQIEWQADGATGPLSIPVRLPADAEGQQFTWTLITEQGSRWQGHFCPAGLGLQHTAGLNQVSYQERVLQLADVKIEKLPVGYHRFLISPQNETAQKQLSCSMSLIVAPSRCHEPQWTLDNQRLWGFSVQLYSLRSEHNWGIGDFGDLRELIRLCSANGANYLILNPLHAADAANPAHCSPYSPSDRRRLNPLYLEIGIEPEFLACLTTDPSLMASLRSQITTLNQLDLVSYPEVSQLKYRVFNLMYAEFLKHHAAQQTPRFKAWREYQQREQEALRQFVQWQAENPPHVSDPVTAQYTRDPDFYAYLQWLTENQLEQCQQLALSLGMQTGLIRDLAVGSDVTGAEVTMNSQSFCSAASIGAPPDPLAPQGQNWGLPPLDPLRLRQSAYTHFIDLLRTNMAHCGALRIDHVMSLMRLWWCTAGGHSGQGAYVHYPVKDLFALLCLESQRNACMVIGEDLGVVPPEVRRYLNTSGIFSNILFYFEKYDGVQFRRPEHFAIKALCMVANHDVPTMAAWWNGSDLSLRRKLDLIGDDIQLQMQWQARQAEQQQVLRWLEEQWLLPANRFHDKPGVREEFDVQLCAAIMQCCARSQSQLLSVQLDDLVQEQTPVNIPGTSTEYPNWQRKLPLSLWDALDGEVDNLMLTAIRQERP
jgi:4-alpha-glucanotransferase